MDAGSSPATRVEPKLYAIARRDLAPGLRTAQVGHALIEWTCEHGRPPDNLVVLAVPDRGALYTLWRSLRHEYRTVPFFEPDLDDDLTALVVGPEGWRRLSSLPLLR